MDKLSNVFISWSGQRSKLVAEFLSEWLRSVINAARPWVSSHSIDAGSRNQDEIAKALQGCKCGIICLTPENLDQNWILYEAGALSKTIDEKTRLCTYLLGGLEPQNVGPPLGWFQATMADKEGTRKLLRTLNAAVSDDPLPDETVDRTFNVLWPELEQIINNLPSADKSVPAKRSVEEMVAEVLDILRAEANSRPDIEDLMIAIHSLRGYPYMSGLEGPIPGVPSPGGLFSGPAVSPVTGQNSLMLRYRAAMGRSDAPPQPSAKQHTETPPRPNADEKE